MTYPPEIGSAFHRLHVITLRGESETDQADYHAACEHLATLLMAHGVSEFKKSIDDYFGGSQNKAK